MTPRELRDALDSRQRRGVGTDALAILGVRETVTRVTVMSIPPEIGIRVTGIAPTTLRLAMVIVEGETEERPIAIERIQGWCETDPITNPSMTDLMAWATLAEESEEITMRVVPPVAADLIIDERGVFYKPLTQRAEELDAEGLTPEQIDARILAERPHDDVVDASQFALEAAGLDGESD